VAGAHRRSRSWWEQQGYRANHPQHSGTEFYVKGRDDAEGKFEEEHTEDERGGPVRITVAPTKTSNPGRPRTVAMGYDYGTDTLRVVFREGAVYDYFGVSTAQWWQMKRSASPGKFLNRRLSGNEYTRVEG
jgi:hypothetical protein